MLRTTATIATAALALAACAQSHPLGRIVTIIPPRGIYRGLLSASAIMAPIYSALIWWALS